MSLCTLYFFKCVSPFLCNSGYLVSVIQRHVRVWTTCWNIMAGSTKDKLDSVYDTFGKGGQDSCHFLLIIEDSGHYFSVSIM